MKMSVMSYVKEMSDVKAGQRSIFVSLLPDKLVSLPLLTRLQTQAGRSAKNYHANNPKLLSGTHTDLFFSFLFSVVYGFFWDNVCLLKAMQSLTHSMSIDIVKIET